MRDESNRIIQGMERQRRAEKEQRDENLRAMQENAYRKGGTMRWMLLWKV